MDKRYQVFVSSTYTDLQRERQEVMHVLLELDCFPSGMELFPAADEGQWDLIKRVIDECDYYVLILAGRYGSTDGDGVSYTEKEYRYALSIGKPTIAFLHKDPGSIPVNNTEQTDDGKKKLSNFRRLVEQKLCKMWDTADELGSVVSRSIVQLKKRSHAVGWVRANELADSDATKELLRLRKRNEELEAELLKARTSAPEGTEELAQDDERYTLRFSYKKRIGTGHPSACSGSCEVTWNELFSAIAPHMINGIGERDIQYWVDTLIDEKWQGSGKITDVAMHQDDFQTVKIQLRALGLMRISNALSKRRSTTCWVLTPYGDEVMTKLRAVRRKSVAGDASLTQSDDVE